MASFTETRNSRRKTRIVCISDTHNQTPKLPPGDVLIHAGDLTNQGSISELRKTVEWIERADFEVKIVIAGNHDITLDNAFYEQHGTSWRWPEPQEPDECKKLLRESPSITYLENETTTVRLTSPNGPRTTFTVFGSPCTPKYANWAFQYGPQDAEKVWSKVPEGVDVVVTHTPPRGLGDRAKDETRSGCPALLRRLAEVKPVLSICGHIHGGRGVSRATWSTAPGSDSSLVQEVEYWTDPGLGNKKISLANLTNSGRPSGGLQGLTRQPGYSGPPRNGVGGQPDAPRLGEEPCSGHGKVVSISSLTSSALRKSEALWGPRQRKETVVINAAHLGPRVKGKATGYDKAIVVDVELPVWQGEGDEHV